MKINGVEIIELIVNSDNRGWLTEVFRSDQIDPSIFPEMAYISETNPKITRGPHEHLCQTDIFVFIHPFWRVKLWDNNPNSSTYENVIDLFISCPTKVIVPPKVVHAYTNLGDIQQFVLNFPNKLYRGLNKKDEIDEIRHENGIEFVMGEHKWTQII